VAGEVFSPTILPNHIDMNQENDAHNKTKSSNVEILESDSPDSLLGFSFQQTQEESNKEYFFIRQMPTIAKITGALEMPKKSFLYRLLT
jgi:hypothetical protein